MQKYFEDLLPAEELINRWCNGGVNVKKNRTLYVQNAVFV